MTFLHRQASSILLERFCYGEDLSSVLTVAGLKSHSVDPYTILPLRKTLAPTTWMFRLGILLRLLINCGMLFDCMVPMFGLQDSWLTFPADTAA